MAVHRITDMKQVAPLFDGWDETFIWSCLQGYMGAAYADQLHSPASAQIINGDFCLFAGVVNYDLVRNRPGIFQSNYVIMAPQNDAWAKAIELHYKENASQHIRYAIKKEKDVFDVEKLEQIVSQLSAEYELILIDHALYKQILASDWAQDLCFNYPTYEKYSMTGLGVVILKGNEIVSGASSYISFHNGIEVEIDTREDERRKGLALVCGAKLILECLKRDWYPSWDAHNKESLALAEKLGYHFDKEYLVYEVTL